MVRCPQCKKIIELSEEDNTGENLRRWYTCNKCGIYIAIEKISDKEVLKDIGYEEEIE
jgi:ribosomal protein L32